eukprot:CAMPEP_0182865414 /NCGR_PEP_ID=MMETSP0034_2-20130328/7674_1 /TAXON_ID=156128 /ORGANISM="Nephroselmis pyriformis, Strain CCMP717" /LENGTH=1056 /DNA_ID=CAMNT_0024997707 /DNA_START=203 /DNA_END=3373 /DNA_ORIENTATION=-
MAKASMILALACMVVMLPASMGALMAIDFGSEFIKVSLVQPGRTPIEIVVNEMSKRKTPAVVAFSNGERLLGEEAVAIHPRFPDRVYSRMRDLLGRRLDDPYVERLLKENYLPYTLVEDAVRNTIRVKTHTGEEYSVEEIVASTLHYCHEIAEAHANSKLREAVITVPAFFGQNQRQALLDAAEMAGLNVLSLIAEHSAAGLVFGIDRVSNVTQDVVLFDVGAGSSVASYVQYSTWTGKEFGKTKEYGQFVVKDVRFDAEIGGDAFDRALLEHFADEFKAKSGKDIRENPRAIAKMKKQVKRTKEILSANNAAPISVEGLMDDMDFRSEITRETFEGLVADVFPRMVQPLKDLMEDNNLTSNPDLLVEMLGGSTRVPRVQAKIAEVLGEIPLSKHLDADEAVAWGAGLHAANLSTAFRVRKFGMTDGAVYPLELEMEEPEADPENPPAEGEEPDLEAGGVKRRTLLPRMKKLPVKRIVSLPNVDKDEVNLKVFYKDLLPPGVYDDLLGDWTISGIVNASTKYNTTIGKPKVNVHFEVSRSGILTLAKAEAVIDMMETYYVDVPKNVTENVTKPAEGEEAEEGEKKNASEEGEKNEAAEGEEGEKKEADEEPAAEEGEKKEAEEEPAAETEEGEKNEAAEGEEGEKKDAAEGEEGEKKDAAEGEEGEKEDKKAKKKKAKKKAPAKPKVEYEKVKKERKRTTRLPLIVGDGGLKLNGLDGETLSVSITVLEELYKLDVIKAENAEAKNSLEAYSISTREKLQENEDLEKVTTEEMREEFSAKLMDAEDWLYGDGESAPTEELRAKLAELKEVGDGMFYRASQLEARPVAMEKARKYVASTRELLAKWKEDRPWINATEIENVEGMLNSAEEWMDGKDEAQAQKELYEEPAYDAGEVEVEMRVVDGAMKKLSKKKPPPPPKKEKKNATATNATDSNSTEGEPVVEEGAAAEEGEPAGASGEGEAPEEGAAAEEGAAEEGAAAGEAAEEGAAEEGAAEEAAKEQAEDPPAAAAAAEEEEPAAAEEGEPAAAEEGEKVEGKKKGKKGKKSSMWGSRDRGEL